jgi:predicted nucleic acid-binding protein
MHQLYRRIWYHTLPLADNVMLATAQTFGATLWTQDADFEGLPGVQHRAKQPKR